MLNAIIENYNNKINERIMALVENYLLENLKEEGVLEMYQYSQKEKNLTCIKLQNIAVQGRIADSVSLVNEKTLGISIFREKDKTPWQVVEIPIPKGTKLLALSAGGTEYEGAEYIYERLSKHENVYNIKNLSY